MSKSNIVEELYKKTLESFWGLDTDNIALGGTALSEANSNNISGKLAEFMKEILHSSSVVGESLDKEYKDDILNYFNRIKKLFVDYYINKADTEFFKTRADIIFNSKDSEKKAKAVAELWSEELAFDEKDVFDKWKLRGARENPNPITADQVIIQLNALYGLADSKISGNTSAEKEYNEYLKKDPERIAIYDHPVPVFAKEDDHELIKCLVEMDKDIAFEKKMGILPSGHSLPVLVSVSTTHEGLDSIVEKWLLEEIQKKSITNISCYLLTENKARLLDQSMGGAAKIFTVQGKYACHFAALKYAQLLFDKSMGIRAGFKLDTDEGMMSKALHKVTGKTWLETMCHPYWGGVGRDFEGFDVDLGINTGEYVDSRDLDSLGYKKAIRTPEVKVPTSYKGPFLLFQKGIVQAKATALYNKAKKLDEFIAHPLVKGGGYGMENRSLRKHVPVGFSMVGRAEDQQFYFSTVGSGLVGIFHPDLRIIHYKESVAGSEKSNAVGRNVSDIYRMLLSEPLMKYLNVRNKLVPFPANYGSPLVPAQAFFLWIYMAFCESVNGAEEDAEQYLKEGIVQLMPLLEDLDSGKVEKKYKEEKKAWREFIKAIDDLSKENIVKWVENLKLAN